MSAFAAGEIDILVANHGELSGGGRAQRHLDGGGERGAVRSLPAPPAPGPGGVGERPSLTVSVVSDHRGEETRRRLKALCATNDGFRIAEEDLKLRGPGDFFGARQHGLPQLRVADLAGDMRVLQEAREAVEWVLQADPGLQKRENRGMLNHIKSLFRDCRDSFN